MDGGGPLRVVSGGTATGVGTLETRLVQPAAQATAGRQGLGREMLGQNQADQFTAPVRVFLAQGLGLEEERGGGLRPGGRAVIGRGGRLAPVVVAQADQVVHGPLRQVETLGQGLGRQPALVSAEYGLTDR